MLKVKKRKKIAKIDFLIFLFSVKLFFTEINSLRAAMLPLDEKITFTRKRNAVPVWISANTVQSNLFQPAALGRQRSL